MATATPSQSASAASSVMCGACRRVGVVGHLSCWTRPEPEGVGREAIQNAEAPPRAQTQSTQNRRLSLSTRGQTSLSRCVTKLWNNYAVFILLGEMLHAHIAGLQEIAGCPENRVPLGHRSSKCSPPVSRRGTADLRKPGQPKVKQQSDFDDRRDVRTRCPGQKC